MQPLLVKDQTKSFVGRYRFTKAKLETADHFALQDEIVSVRNRLSDVQTNIYKKRKAAGFFAWVKYWATKKELVILAALHKELSAEMQGLIRQLHRVCKTEIIFAENIVPTVGRTMIANNLTDATPTNSMLISHAALGTDGTTPANGDTTLGTETYRNAIASLTNGSNVGYATAFFNATEVTGTFAEAGIFSDGTGSVDTGILVSHVLISVTKSSSETLTIDWELTIN